eukprot:3092676-Prymnesium_polylepis.2
MAMWGACGLSSCHGTARPPHDVRYTRQHHRARDKGLARFLRGPRRPLSLCTCTSSTSWWIKSPKSRTWRFVILYGFAPIHASEAARAGCAVPLRTEIRLDQTGRSSGHVVWGRCPLPVPVRAGAAAWGGSKRK